MLVVIIIRILYIHALTTANLVLSCEPPVFILLFVLLPMLASLPCLSQRELLLGAFRNHVDEAESITWSKM